MPKGIVLGVPTRLGALRDADVVGAMSLLRAAMDLIRISRVLPGDAMERATSGAEDPSVAAVFGTRLGDEILRTLIDPLLGGINASDVDSLSLAACAPQLLRRIQGERSVMRALGKEPATFAPGPTRPPFIGLKRGMASLAIALEDACRSNGAELRPSSAVTGLHADSSGRWKLSTHGGSTEVDAVVIAAPAFAAAKLLSEPAPGLAPELGAIPYASVATACFSFDKDAVPQRIVDRLRAVVPSAKDSAAVLAGSGVLVPRDGKHLMTAATFTSSKWPRSAAPGQVLIRTFAGRHADERALNLDDRALREGLLADLASILGITSAPTGFVMQRWIDALPQYVTGHLARLERVRNHLKGMPSLGLTGASYTGIGIPACIDNAEAAATRILEHLQA
jgi:oxygen-dependent protoporphyrinogen oxidase